MIIQICFFILETKPSFFYSKIEMISWVLFCWIERDFERENGQNEKRLAVVTAPNNGKFVIGFVIVHFSILISFLKRLFLKFVHYIAGYFWQSFQFFLSIKLLFYSFGYVGKCLFIQHTCQMQFCIVFFFVFNFKLRSN